MSTHAVYPFHEHLCQLFLNEPLAEPYAEHRGERTRPGPPLSLGTLRRLAWEVRPRPEVMFLGPLQSLHDLPDDLTQVEFR